MKTTLIALIFTSVFLTGISCGSHNRVNVLIILLDTVRADHLSCYGSERQTTPNIDSLAAAGIIAARCQGQSSWTLPSMTSILSGTSPAEHGAGRKNGVFHGVAADLPWLPHAFHSEGYRTAAFFNVMFMNEDFGFHRGFQHFDCRGVASGNSLRKAGPTVDDFLSWLDTSDGNKPFFAAVHFYDPHIPYNPPAPYNTLYTDQSYTGTYGEGWGTGITEMMQVNSGEVIPSQEDIYNLEALYDGEISYTDAEMGRLFQELRNRGLAGNTIIVVVGDHGEEFLEHGGIEHGRTLYQELTHVPLIIAGPGFNSGSTIRENVAQLDIAATVTAAAGIEYVPGELSRNLAETVETDRQIPASGVLWRTQGDLISIVSGNSKIIWSVEDDSLEAFHLDSDPGEHMAVEPESALLQSAEYYRTTPPLTSSPEVDYSETAARELRNLGYIR